MKQIQLTKQTQSLIAMAIGAIVVAVVWVLRAPSIECFVSEGTCVYYVERNSDFFVADALFSFCMFTLGVIFALFYQRAWWEAGFLFQLGLAAYGLLLSILVALGGQILRPLTMINELKADAGLELRTLGALLILPAVVQVIVTVSGTAHGTHGKKDEGAEHYI